MIFGGKPSVLAAAAALSVIASLVGCTAAAAPSAQTATPTSIPTSARPTPAHLATATAVPTPVADAPLDARSAWEACAAVADREYISSFPEAEIHPFSSHVELETDADGNPFVVVGIKPPQPLEGVGSIIVICTMAGTAAAPEVVKWTMKDI